MPYEKPAGAGICCSLPHVPAAGFPESLSFTASRAAFDQTDGFSHRRDLLRVRL